MTRTVALAASALLSALSAFTGAAVASAQSVCDQLGGNVQSGNVCNARKETPLYVIDIRYDTDYPDDQPVGDFLTQARDRVVSAAQTAGAKHLPYSMTVTSQTFRSGQPTRTTREYGQPWHGTQSLVLADLRSVDGPPAGTFYKSFTFDYDRRSPVTLANLFAPGVNPMDSIYPAVKTEMERQQFYRNFHLSPAMGRDSANYQNFAITDDAVIFFFDVGEFGLPAEAGYFFAPISRSILPPLQI